MEQGIASTPSVPFTVSLFPTLYRLIQYLEMLVEVGT